MELQRQYNLGKYIQLEFQQPSGRIELKEVLFRTRFVSISEDVDD